VDSVPSASKAYTIVRPNLLLARMAPEHQTLSNWADGRVSCRQLGGDMFSCGSFETVSQVKN